LNAEWGRGNGNAVPGRLEQFGEIRRKGLLRKKIKISGNDSLAELVASLWLAGGNWGHIHKKAAVTNPI